MVAEKGVSRDEFYLEEDLEVGELVAYYDYGWVEGGHFLGRAPNGWAYIRTVNGAGCDSLETLLNMVNAGDYCLQCFCVQPHQVRKPGDY